MIGNHGRQPSELVYERWSATMVVLAVLDKMEMQDILGSSKKFPNYKNRIEIEILTISRDRISSKNVAQ